MDEVRNPVKPNQPNAIVAGDNQDTVRSDEEAVILNRPGVTSTPGGWPGRWYSPPLVISAVLWVFAALTHAWWGVLAGVLGTVVTAAAGGVWVKVVLHRRRDRVWAIAASLTATGWLPLAAAAAPWSKIWLPAFAVSLPVLSAHWWRHPWTQRRVQIDRDYRAWPTHALQLGIPAATLISIELTRVGRRFAIDLQPGQTWRLLRAEAAESVLGVAPGAVSVERDMGSARRVYMHVRDIDPWVSDIVAHPALAVLEDPDRELTDDDASPWRPGAGSVKDPVEVGVRLDFEPAALPVWRADIGAVHWVVAGITGSGKSVFYRVLMAGLSRCRDVEIWGIDTGKLGKAFTPWAPVMSRIASNLAEAVELLRDARALIETSASEMAAAAAAGEGSDNVEPTPERPLVAIIIDEAADLLDTSYAYRGSDEDKLRLAAVELLESITARARSEAVSVILATQRPDNASLGGSSKLRSHCTVGVCLRMRSAGDIKWALQGPAVDELDVSLFRHPGMLYAQVGPDTVPMPIRAYALLTPAEARSVATWLAPGMARRSARTPRAEASSEAGHGGSEGRRSPNRHGEGLVDESTVTREDLVDGAADDLPPVAPIPLAELARLHAGETLPAGRTHLVDGAVDDLPPVAPIPLAELARLQGMPDGPGPVTARPGQPSSGLER